MSHDVKQVKVDNWGIYFLQRLKHFFNRTDYCDLTLQFQDNAQLKVHRLVLSACTEYFELLERTCEMYEDCLVMPDDLQADIVVPIVNFMYTGQLEFRMELLEKLHQCSEIMNMPVLTKLLDSHRPKPKVTSSYKHPVKRIESSKEVIKKITPTEVITTTTPVTYKRSHSKAFEQTTIYRDKKVYLANNKPSMVTNGGRVYREPSPIPLDTRFNKNVILGDPRPTRYELPEEFDSDNIFENSFCNISYTSQPLMIHPETRKQYSKKPRIAAEASTSKKATTIDIVECKKSGRVQEDALFEDSIPDETEMYPEPFVKTEKSRDSNLLFDQILERNEEPPKVTIETKTHKTGNLDHAKIISEVLKKYPHLVKSNKNIKLKILNTQSTKKKSKLSPESTVNKPIKMEKQLDYTYETEVLDSKQAAKLIALGAENIEGPWICLICGTPGKAMNFTSYYKFRRHLIEVHNEKPVLNICEFCGHKSGKRNYIVHHMYTKHGVDPPANYNFPKCNQCNYIALTEALLLRHKTSSHNDAKNFKCYVCPLAFHTSSQLLQHIQSTGHKYSDKKSNLQCIYCLKVFMRENNLYAHLKIHHKNDAIKDGIIDESDEEDKKSIVKSEPISNDFEELDIQYQIQQRPDGNITVVTKKVPEPTSNTKQKILNAGLSTQNQTHKNKVEKNLNTQTEFAQEMQMSSNDIHEEIVMIDNNEYIVKDNQLIPRKSQQEEEYIIPDNSLQPMTSNTPIEFTQDNIQHANVLLKNQDNVNQAIPIYVSNEEEYKALMASNQPIIFDSGDSNKTLTVLTAPHTSALGTTAIDLNTTQSNNMMIIQDEYPLNVSQAVASDNSNIVVVYSHQVGDESKQYQLLTTQGLGPQFVQSSAILTQNYETITTTTPVTHVLEKQVEEDWQNNLNQIVETERIEITPVTSLHTIVQQNNQVQTQSIINIPESGAEIVDLPQVELSSNITETIHSNNDVTVSQCQDMVVEEVLSSENVVENSGVVGVDNIQHTYDMEENECTLDHTEHSDVTLDQSVETVDSTNLIDTIVENETRQEEEIVPTNDTIIQEAEYVESQTYTQQDPNIETCTDNIDEIQNQSEEMSIDSQTGEIIESNEDEPACDSNIISEVSVTTEQTMTVDISEKVQSLTSEWSEEDRQVNVDNAIQTQDTQAIQTENIQHIESKSMCDKDADSLKETQIETIIHNDTNVLSDEQQNDTETEELEESIENIQQEVEKQMAASTSTEKQIMVDNDENNTSLDESVNEPKLVVPTPIIDPVVAQEKISSLLNDWEDNDSREDNNSTNENVAIDSDVIVESDLIDTPTPAKENDQHEKIKSLVSDWDEDEEENRE